MAGTKERVQSMVEFELRADRHASTAALQAKAAKIDKSFGRLTPRQFHARFAIPVKRRLGKSASQARTRQSVPARKQPGVSPWQRVGNETNAAARDDVRRILLRFAGEVASAETKADVVDVLRLLDQWANELTAAVRR
jgi:hypothetical protein